MEIVEEERVANPAMSSEASTPENLSDGTNTYPNTNTNPHPDRERTIVAASWLAIIGNGILSVLKIAVGIIAGSLAVVGDGIDSATDIITSMITLLTARIISKPPNVKYPYGYEKADTIAAKVLSFVIFFAGAQLGISTIQRIVAGHDLRVPSILAIYATVISILGKLGLAYQQYRVGKRVNSGMLIANAKNMQNDVLISISVLTGLFFTTVLKMPILDTFTALVVSIWIMKTAFGIFMDTYTELMDGMTNPELYTEIIKVIEGVNGASNPHRMRLRKLGNRFMLEMDLEVDGNLTVYKSHKIAHKVEEELRKTIVNLYDVVIHVEPDGDEIGDEKFGISIQNIN